MKLDQGCKSLFHYLDIMTDEDAIKVKALAHHEAGHAVFTWRNGRHLGRFGVSMNPNDKIGISTQGWIMDKQKCSSLYSYSREQEFDYADLEMLIAGPAAQDKFLRLHSRKPCGFQSSYADYDSAQYIVKLYPSPGEDPEERLRKEYRRISSLMDHPKTWAAVEAVADGLLRYNYLNNESTMEIIRQSSPPKKRRYLTW